ncbi:MAG: murein biosynthesis integral membrane protein MurJ [Spirochaetales bacterium]|nr:murein biosynthesis integral membrane protein MurJ [Spirochaetales bacterium]
MPDSTKNSNEKNSLVLMFCTLLSRCLGVIKAIVTSHYFGAGALNDAINFAYNIPNSARKLFAEGALNTAYVPSFTDCEEDKRKSESLLGALLSFQLLIFIVLIAISFLFGRTIINFLSAFEDENQLYIASSLLPLFTIFLTFISFASVFSGILQVKKSFFAIGICPIFYSSSVILAIIFFAPKYSAFAFGYGTIVGSFFQYLFCKLTVKKIGLKPHYNFNFKDQEFLKVFKRFIPIAFTSLITVVALQFTYSFASILPEGSISAFSNAIVLYQTPYGIVFSAIATVYYPEFNKLKDNTLRVKSLNKCLSDLLCFLLPFSIILLTLNKEIISLLFQHGEFTLENTILTSKVSIFYFSALIIISFYSLLQRYCYSIDIYWATTIVHLIVNSLDLLFSYLFIKYTNSVIALPISYIITLSLGLIALLTFVKGLKLKAFVKENVKLLIANIPITVCCLFIASLNLKYYKMGTTLKGALCTIALGVGLLLVMFISYLIFKVPFLASLKRKK